MSNSSNPSLWSRVLPGLSLMILAPLLAEILPGATRFSAIFVLPIEIFMWGGGALFIRYAVRRWHLGWRNMLLLALALAVAEECLIQQTSLAPLVIQIKGQEYARAFGVNYVYLLWALVYESVFVVFAPVYLAELIFRERRDGPWLGGAGRTVVAGLFALGALLAWYSWTRIARPQVFHAPIYHPPVLYVVAATVSIALLLFGALGPFRKILARPSKPLSPPAPWLLGTAAFVWATLLYVLVVLAFGIAPTFPPAIAAGGGIILAITVVLWLPRWTAHADWGDRHQFAALFGVILGSMLLSFVGFIGGLRMDLYFKIIVDALAVVWLLWLRVRLGRRPQVCLPNPIPV